MQKEDSRMKIQNGKIEEHSQLKLTSQSFYTAIRKSSEYSLLNLNNISNFIFSSFLLGERQILQNESH